MQEKVPVRRVGSDPHSNSGGLLCVPGLRQRELGSTQRLELLVRHVEENWPEAATPSDDVSPECLSPAATLIPPPYRAATSSNQHELDINADLPERTITSTPPSANFPLKTESNRNPRTTSKFESDKSDYCSEMLNLPIIIAAENFEELNLSPQVADDLNNEDLSSDTSSIELTNVTPLFITPSEIAISIASSSSSQDSKTTPPLPEKVSAIVEGEYRHHSLQDPNEYNDAPVSVCKIQIDDCECERHTESEDSNFSSNVEHVAEEEGKECDTVDSVCGTSSQELDVESKVTTLH